MTAQQLRTLYIEYFRGLDHSEISGASLIPENDPTVLFTTAGMHPLVPYILGEPHPGGNRLVDCQKCIRTGDIEEVGDVSHLTFFEMLGNWSLGDYFKEQSIAYSYTFLTAPEWLGFSPDQLYVTVFAGDEHAPADQEAAEIWRKLGLPDERIFFLGRQDNWWGPAGQTGPCGPDTEIFVDTGKAACSSDCRPGCSCGKYFEIWNNVFMQYNKSAEGTYTTLDHKTVDTGMGVERTAAMIQGKRSVFEIELLQPILASIEQISDSTYGASAENDVSMRIITDHVRAATFILGDEKGITPSNLGQGYILRRLIRRAIRHGRKLGIEQEFLTTPALKVIELYSPIYPELERQRQVIVGELKNEAGKFLKTLQKGEQEFEKLLPNLLKNPHKVVPGRVAFRLYDTYGFPVEITEELAAEHGMTVDRPGFEAAFKKHQQASKAGADKVFKGGLADQTDMTKKLHTATHLLHQALRTVLGDHVQQKGSNITSERLRFDFTHPDKMTPEQIEAVEGLVNQQIQRGLSIGFETMTLQQARDCGAIALFGDKYEEKVKVYSIGDFSREVCGGPHVDNTSILGVFKISKEQSSSAGVRRIRAVLADG